MTSYSISALMPVRNGSTYLPASMKCLDANSEFLSEIVVVDDGSSDDTSKLLRDWEGRNSKVNLYRTRGLGLVPALNLGLQNIKSDFVARFDVDDLYSNNRIALQMELVTPETVVVFSDYDIFSGSKKNLGTIPSPVFASETSVSLVRQQRTAHPSALINRAALEEVGGYRLDDYPAEDFSLWLRLAKIGNLISVPQPLLKYRISSSSISSTQARKMYLKRNELLRYIGVNKVDVLASISRLEEFGTRYLDVSQSSNRQFLHLLELQAACELVGARYAKSKLIKDQLKLLASLENALEIAKFGWKTFERKAFKLFLN